MVATHCSAANDGNTEWTGRRRRVRRAGGLFGHGSLDSSVVETLSTGLTLKIE